MQPLRAQLRAPRVTRSQKDENSYHNGEGMVRARGGGGGGGFPYETDGDARRLA